MTSFEIETEALFYRLLHSYLLQQPPLKENYQMFLDHYQKHPESFRILKKNEILWLKRIQDDVNNNRFTLFSASLDLTPAIPGLLKSEKSNQNHKLLCKEIIQHKTLLEPFIGSIKEMNAEHPVLFGFVDLVAYNDRSAYIIEVKSESADHSIIGQVMKYYIGMCLNLVLKLYDEVKMITLCPGYDQVSYSGLRQIGALPLLISPKPLKICMVE